MKTKSFTLVEILVGLIIVAVLASLSIVTYQRTVEANNDRICKDNLKILQSALDIYTLENNSLPTTLAQLNSRYIYLAEQKVLGQPKENKGIAYFKNLLGPKAALAQTPSSLARYYANQRNIWVCPNDKTTPAPPPNGCNTSFTSTTCGSYTFNFTGDTWNVGTHRLEKNSTFALVYDSADRHRGKITNTLRSNGITPKGIRGRINTSNQVAKIIANSCTPQIDCTKANCSKFCEGNGDDVPENPADD